MNSTPQSKICASSNRWSDGSAELSFSLKDGETRLKHLYQSDPCRVLFPSKRAKAPKEAVIVTTSGGIVGGDRLEFDMKGGKSTTATVMTQAAEKVYRSAGKDSVIDCARQRPVIRPKSQSRKTGSSTRWFNFRKTAASINLARENI